MRKTIASKRIAAEKKAKRKIEKAERERKKALAKQEAERMTTPQYSSDAHSQFQEFQHRLMTLEYEQGQDQARLMELEMSRKQQLQTLCTPQFEHNPFINIILHPLHDVNHVEHHVLAGQLYSGAGTM